MASSQNDIPDCPSPTALAGNSEKLSRLKPQRWAKGASLLLVNPSSIRGIALSQSRSFAQSGLAGKP
jgi:hypothetical protein